MRATREQRLTELLHRLPAWNLPPVLVYHNVGDAMPNTDPGLTISVAAFERQLDWLTRCGFVGITVATWCAGLAGRVELPQHPVVLTFDDGYRQLAEHALPLVRAHGHLATVFVVTGYLGGISAWMPQESARQPLLSANEIQSWAEQGIDFGSHSRTHPDLTAVDPAMRATEIRGSRDDLASVLGRPVGAFAYPFGRVDAETHREVARSYDIAFTVLEGPNRPTGDLHALRRSGALEEDSLVDLAFRLQLGWTPRHRVRLRIRRQLGRARGQLVRSMDRRARG